MTFTAGGALEANRVEIIALYLHEKARQSTNPGVSAENRLAGQLSEREFEVALAVSRGLTNKEVAQELRISVRTVENHLRAVFAKLRVSTRTRLVTKVHRILVETSAS